MNDYAPPQSEKSQPTQPRLEDGILRFHRDRERLFNELHTRPFPVIAAPARVSQLALLHGGEPASEEFRHIEALCHRYSVLPPSRDSSCYYQDFGGFELRWERHTEFSTYTFIAYTQGPEPFQRTALSLLPQKWLQALPGEVVSGLHVEVEPMPENEPAPEDVRQWFEGQRLISSWVENEQARLWTAYRLHSDGLGRVLVLNRSLNPCQTGRLVRRLLELETYRMVMLLGFPIARDIAPQVTDMDQQLATINQQITDIEDLDDERRLLGELTTLAARIEQLISDTNYRFSASRAYYALVISRLEELRETDINGMQTFSAFLRRRLTPAYRTCEAISEDLDDLSRRIDRASELLRTRVNLTIEAQNQSLLQSMNRRGKLQLRLQQAVEGLSVAAISYYLVGLTKYMAESGAELGLIEHPAIIVGASVPVIVGCVWAAVHRVRKVIQQG